jgi:hypothetical protein
LQATRNRNVTLFTGAAEYNRDVHTIKIGIKEAPY